MIIHYISRSIIPSRHANSVHIMKMCQAFSVLGHGVTLYAVIGELDQDPFQYYGISAPFQLIRQKRLKLKFLGSFIYSLSLLAAIVRNRQKPDLLYSRDIISIFLLKFYAKFIYESHHLPDKRFKEIMLKTLLSHRNFGKLVVISQQLKNDYLRKYPFIKSDQIFVAHDGADSLGNSVRAKSPSQGKPINIGYIGQLYPGRGADVIVELAKLFPEQNFHIVGGYEKDIDFWRNETKALNNIKFYGYVPNGELTPYYNMLDIMLAPYKQNVYTGNMALEIGRWISPMKIFEYMSYAKPIIVSNLPSIAEVMVDGHNCLMCDPESIESWQQALNKLIESPTLREQLSLNAVSDLNMKFTWQARAQSILNSLAD